MGEMTVNRRTFLRRAGTTAVWTTLVASTGGLARLVRAGDGFSWNDPGAWPDGRVPGPNDIAEVDRVVVLDGDASVAGVVIAPGGALVFDPDRTATLTATGNVVVEGLLEMRPASAAKLHTLRFAGVDESRFVGGGMMVLDSDVGLWVMGDGRLDLQGTPKVPWTRHPDDVGWSASDELLLCPSKPGDYTGFRTFRLGDTVPESYGYRSEVLNLTRNVRVEGTAGGRAHALIHSSSPQTVRFASFRWMGVPERTGGNLEPNLGRYPLHFHHCGQGSRGSVVEGVVARETGNHGFVPHGSDGITFRGCIAYDVQGDAYWWDPRLGPPDNVIETEVPVDDVTWDLCVAARVEQYETLGSGSSVRLSGFRLGSGTPLAVRCTRSVAVGIVGGVDSSGFSWPEGPQTPWVFDDNVSHNNARAGAFVWQNSASDDHLIRRLLAYHNGWAGIEQGAYFSKYVWEDSILLGNGRAGIEQHATSRERPNVFRRIRIEDSPTAVQIAEFKGPPGHALDSAVIYEDLTTSDVDSLVVDVSGSGRSTPYEFTTAGGVAPARLTLPDPKDEVWDGSQSTSVGGGTSPVVTPQSQQTFPDVPSGHWAHDDIEAVAAAGVVKGYPDGTYRPEQVVTRAEMAVVLDRALGHAPSPPKDAPFPDVDLVHWAVADIANVARLGIADGFPDGTFRPESGVTRAQIAAFLTRALELWTPAPAKAPFPDVTVDHWAAADIAALADLGLAKGYPDGSYGPDNDVTRAEMAVFVARAWKI